MGKIIISFSVDHKEDKKLIDKIEELSSQRQLSHWIRKACNNQYESEQSKKIEDFAQPETELDIAPRIHEPITDDYLKQLSPKDVIRLHKMLYYNKEILDRYFHSYSDEWQKRSLTQ